LLASQVLFRSRTRADRAGRDARRLRSRRTRNDRWIGLFIRRSARISKKNLRHTGRRTISSKLDARRVVHHRAGPQGGVYERLTLREQKISDIETAKFIEEGKEDIPQPDKLGGTIGVSCDMCHPDAVNTDPETYPKYQS
jgi:hypothetical protein